MRNIFTVLSLVLILLVTSCNSKKSTTTNSEATDAKIELQTYNFDVEGMTCTGCEQTIQANVRKLEGIQLVSASHTEKKATVSFDPDKTDTIAIKQAIVGSGYTVTGITQSLE
ncbi:cation transporter [Saccharicrinis sp. FJH2]|uniref:cation transporter n=1 Tax=unclassified Saccharicrinis TaxID=2646859 RepID=UPI0035D46B62